MPEPEAEVEEPTRDRPLTGCDDRRHLAVEQPQGEAGDRQDGRPVKRSPERPGEIRIRDRLRCGDVERAGRLAVIQAEQDRRDRIIEMDPGHVLPATCDGSADAEPEERKHPSKGSTRGRQNEPASGSRHTHERVCGLRLVLPGGYDPREKIVSRRSLLVELHVAGRAIEADGRLRDENLRPRRGAQIGQARDELTSAQNARIADSRPGVIGPSLGDRLSEEMNDPRSTRQCLRRRGGSRRVRPDVDLDVAPERRLRAAPITRQRDDFVTALTQGGDNRAPDRARRSGDQDARHLCRKARR